MLPFAQFLASGSNFNPRNIQYIPVVKNFSPSLNLNEIEHFSKVSLYQQDYHVALLFVITRIE